MSRRIPLPADPPEMSDEQRITALDDEARLLRPYASTAGLGRLKLRLREIDRAMHRLRGLPLGEVSRG
jgi:hypothetical protein